MDNTSETVPALVVWLIIFIVLFIWKARKYSKAKKQIAKISQELNQANQEHTKATLVMQEQVNAAIEKTKTVEAESYKSIQEYEKATAFMRAQVNAVLAKLKAIGAERYEEVTAKVDSLNIEIAAKNADLAFLNSKHAALKADILKLEKQISSSSRKLDKIKELYNAAMYSIEKYANISDSSIRLPAISETDAEEFMPSVELSIQCMNMRDLLKAFKANDKQIDEVTESYRSRYTTKVNQTIYALMVIALRAELQNILYDLKLQKLETGIENVKAVTQKYLAIACNGNQSIAPTMTKFVGEMEYLFINAVKIEYNYYIRKEQSRQEQLAIREQMKQEAAERKALEAERKKIENEESKYKAHILEIQEKLKIAADAEKDALEKRIMELEGKLSEVVLKKDEISNLQNGKAGNVYIISNLGSFGDSMFKIGMTRRLDPQERIDELGSASVPFEFDVHSFIFSEDAVALENELHKRLNDKRVNKVNSRKEFFYSSLDELEALTNEISPTAIFNRTMAAEEYRQSMSMENVMDDIISEDEPVEVETAS